MSGRRRVCVVITARPSYARIRSALEALRTREDVELQIVLAASALLERYGRVEKVVEQDGFEVAWRILSVVEGEGLLAAAKSTGAGLMETATALANLKPDVVVTVADRYETIATAVAAAYQNMPLAHIQGGEVTGNIDDRVRHAITKLADLHLVASEGAAARVISMSEEPERVIITGCPSIDIARAALDGPPLDGAALARFGGVGPAPDLAQPFVVVLQHPVTTEHGQALAQTNETLEAIQGLGLPALWFWPNIDAGSDGTSKAIRAFRERHPENRIQFVRNVPPEDFSRLLAIAPVIVGNSSAAIREGSYLGTPAVNIGSRQVGRKRAPNVIDVVYDRRAIAEAIERQIAHGRYASSTMYGDGNAGVRIAEVLATFPLSLKTPGR